MAHNPEPDYHKRKRHDEDSLGSLQSDRIPHPPASQLVEQTPIKYLAKHPLGKLKILHGDRETFAEALHFLSEYDDVLNRHESLASGLGAKLMGPRLLKGMESVFIGPIITTPAQNASSNDPVTWLDIIEFARAKPGELTVTQSPHGIRCCQFMLKGVQVEITEDDWRLIVSGALDRTSFIRSQPVEEDEIAELATITLLEPHFNALIKKVDEIAYKARQVNYSMGKRKVAIMSRYPHKQKMFGSSGFRAVNQPGQGPGPQHGYDIFADLNQQIAAAEVAAASAAAANNPPRLPSISSVPPTPGTLATAASTPKNPPPQQVYTSQSGHPSPNQHSESGSKEADEEHRSLVTARIDKVLRGHEIKPPCDRCRRLKTTCVKHLTACQGCTKKHARCAWKNLTDEDIRWLIRESGGGEDDIDEQRERRPGSHSAPGSQHESAEPRRDSEQSEDAMPSRPGSRIAIGRHSGDIWRKGTSASVRHDTMEIEVDPRDPRNIRHLTEHPNAHDFRTRDPNPMLLSRVATAASAAADAAAASRNGRLS
ncbi:uncharacterized protein JN550_004912 [Neoarthrinium moseri]|uniref:uncharacterized protein n=1 Tax=Neoarthrinium moseri TaxID=1658444 RepID=UPI001FDDEB66|nr:uncharacterized protein JN550_004912 [Neoarthrinium moseri]KAI1870766.1 hypothetical protein JN550_004912 [Neoarthrinium moseri]